MFGSEIVIEPIGLSARPTFLERLTATQRVAIGFVFGCILSLSSPGFDFSLLAWVGLVPFLVLLRACSSKTEACFLGFSFGMGYYLVALSWYLGLYPLRWIGLEDWLAVQAAAIIWLTECLHESLLFVGLALLLYTLPMRAGFVPHFMRPYFPYVLSVPLIWLFFQWVVGTSEWFVGLPVSELAYTQCRHLELIQAARFGGAGFIDFLIVLMNAVLACIVVEVTGIARPLVERVDRIEHRTGAFVDLALVSILLVCICMNGQDQIQHVASTTGPFTEQNIKEQRPPVPVAVVQGNVSIEEERLRTTQSAEIADRYERLIRGLGAALIVLPEALIGPDQMAAGMLWDRLRNISGAEKKEIVVGSVEYFDNGKTNAVRILSPLNPKDNLYIKRRLVPFGEFVPLGSAGATIASELNERGNAKVSTIYAKSPHLLKSLFGFIGPSIFIEVVYPQLISKEVRQGANLLVNMSNLSWFHNSFLNRQIVAASIYRAVENGRFMVLATNTGVSAVIDPAGVVTSISYPGKRGVLIDRVQFLYKKTPFSKMWWL